MFVIGALKSTGFSWQTALALATASKLAYESESVVQNMTTRAWGFSSCTFIDINETQGFIAEADDVVLLSFRGSESLGDWLGNLGLMGTARPHGVVHSGFLGAYLVVQPLVSQTLRRTQGKRVLVTGHSLGGALAAIFAAEEQSQFNIGGIYTYGQPRTGSNGFTELFATKYANSCFRFVNDDDIVPRIPPGYQHAGRLIHFDVNGDLEQATTEAEAEKIETPPLNEPDFFEFQREIKHVQRNVVMSGAASDREAVDASIEGLFPSVSDHAIDRYIAAIRRFTVNTAEGQAMRVAAGMRLQAVGLVAMGSAESLESIGQTIPVLLRLNDTNWIAPQDLTVNSRFGSIVSAIATPDQLLKLENDKSIASIERSREGGYCELANSVPFVHGDVVHRPPIDERGANALVGLIDDGIDVMHEAFRDSEGGSRILAVWNQRDATGPSPRKVDPAFTQDYGTVYLKSAIDGFIGGAPLPSPRLRDPAGHGTHVASIAAGRAVGGLSEGVAPESRIVAVVPNMKTEAGQAPSLGYSISHVDALHFLKTLAAGGNKVLKENRPIAVNVSLGMNAGAHDGSSTLEAAFDAISGGGRDPGFVIVKSAGNERIQNGHVRVRAINGGRVDANWNSSSTFRFQDYLEVWYSSLDTLQFELVDPAGNVSETISTANPQFAKPLGGNLCQLSLTELHADNGDNCLTITILSQTAPLQTGIWSLRIFGKSLSSSDCFVNLWLERDDSRPTSFVNGQQLMTLSIPGTARTVVTVSACESNDPVVMVNSSSMGRTRDGRPKPDICAPGLKIAAAHSNQADTRALIPKTGTSMAAPHVTGAAALALSRRFGQIQAKPGRQLNAVQLQAMLIRSARNFNTVHNEESGFGVLDIESLMKQV